MSWSALPVDIQGQILSYLGDSKCRAYRRPTPYELWGRRLFSNDRPVQSRYAAVNRAWNRYFEAKNFKTLILGGSDIAYLYRLVCVAGRAHLLRWIWLRLELPNYACGACTESEKPYEKERNEKIFTDGVDELFDILSRLNCGNDHPGITLQLSVHSPSDAEHHFRDLDYTINDTPWYVAGCSQGSRTHDDSVYGWSSERRLPLVLGSAHRTLGDPVGIGLDMCTARIETATLRVVSVINELYIPLQFPRYFSMRSGLGPIIRALPQLQSLKYECRQALSIKQYQGFRKTRNEENRFLCKEIIPLCESLRKVSIYEASSRCFSQGPHSWMADAETARHLGSNCYQLEELHAAWMIEARYFFHEFWPDDTSIHTNKTSEWPQMKYLSLTTNMIRSWESEKLLQAAAMAARNMPKLETMQLWSHNISIGMLYMVEDRHHSLLVPRDLAESISKTTVGLWNQVAKLRGSPYAVQIMTHGPDDVPMWRHPRSIMTRSAMASTRKQLRLEKARDLMNLNRE